MILSLLSAHHGKHLRIDATRKEKPMIKIRSGHLSITGNFRENNEDNCVIVPEKNLFIVADGMGGQSAGERASALAVELIPQKLSNLADIVGDSEKIVAAVDEAVGHANSEIMALGEIDPEMHSMGTTVVFVVPVGDEFYIGGVGDSRVYQLRGGTLTQLTTDHSLTQALLEHGTITPEEAVNHKYRNVLYRYLGSKEGGTGTQARQVKPQAGDRYLLCSDGVTDGIGDELISDLLAKNDDPKEVAKAIVDAAQEGGSKDNITAMTVFVD